MTDRVRRIMAVREDVVKGLQTRDCLVLPKGNQEIGEFVLGNVEVAHGLSQSHEHRMLRSAFIAGVELALPLVEEGKGSDGVPDFVSEIVGNAAIGVNIEEMLTQAVRKEPACHREVFVMSAGQAR